MPSFLSNKKHNFIKTAKSAKKCSEGKKRPESASSTRSETHSNSSTATVRPIQREETLKDHSITKHVPEKQPIDSVDEEKAMAKKLDALALTMPKSKSDTGFNNYIVSSPTPPLTMQRTGSYGDVKSLHSIKSGASTPVSFNQSSHGHLATQRSCDNGALSRGDRSLAMSRNRREATYCKYLLRNAAHRRSASRLSQKMGHDNAMRSMRDTETPSELTSVTSLSSFGSASSLGHSISSLSQDPSLGKDLLGRIMAKENKNKLTQLLVLSRRRQLAQDDLRAFTLQDIAVCGKRMDRAFVLGEAMHYSGVVYPIKLVSTDDLMFPHKKLAIKVRSFY